MPSALEKLAEDYARDKDHRLDGASLVRLLEEERLHGELHLAFKWAAHFLVVPSVSEEVWGWIIKQAHNANIPYQAALSVCIFELMTDDLTLLKRLFSLLGDEGCRWIFLDLYEEEPSRLYFDLSRVSAT